MEKESPLACTEGEQGESSGSSSVLLAKVGDGVSGRTSSARNKRSEADAVDRRTKKSKAKNSSAKSKVSTRAKDLNADTDGRTKRGRRKQNNKDRKPDNGLEGQDRTPRRSAKELGIRWIGSECPDGSPHFLVARHNFSGGSIFICSNCQKSVWLPTTIQDAAELEQLIKQYGTNTGYLKLLDKFRDAKIMVAKLQYLWEQRQVISDNAKMAKLVVEIMNRKEYDAI